MRAQRSIKKIIAVFVFLSFPSAPFDVLPAQEVLSWEDCLKEAARNNPDIIVADEAVKEKEAAEKIIRSSEYPRVSASLGAAESKSGSDPSRESYSASFSASQLVFDGRKTINNVKAARENIQAAKYNFRYASSGVRQGLRRAFVNLLKAQEMAGLAREIYRIRRDNYELITLRYKSGFEHRGALYTAEANLAQAEHNINTAKRDLRVAQTVLAKQLGRAKRPDLAVEADFTVKDIPDENLDLEALAAKSPQVLKISAQAQAAEFNLRSSYGNYAPSIELSASAGKSGNSFFPQKSEEGAAVSLNLPLFEGGLRAAQVSQAEAALNQLRQNERSARDGTVSALEQYRAALLEALENVEVQKKSLQASEERSQIAEAQYAIGTISFDSWTIIEDNLVSAKSSYLNARAQALLSEADWIMAKGETLEYQQ